MAIAYNTSTNLATGTGTRSWSHTAGASLIGGAGVVIVGGSVDETTGVTYGGATMTRIATGANTGGETGTASVWWIANDESGWPGNGTQTVEISRSASSAYIATCYTVTTASGTSGHVVEGGINVGYDEGSSISISTITTSLTIPSGINVFILGGLYSGENALSSITDNASLTRSHSQDFGTFVGVINRRTAIYTGTGSALTTFAWTQSSDDGGWAAVAIREYILPVVTRTYAQSQVQITISPYATVVKGDNPITYWKFDEVDGDLQDSSGNGHTGTVFGDPINNITRLVPYDNGTASTFVKTNSDYVLSSSWMPIGNNNWSIELWLNTTDSGVIDWLASFGNPGTAGQGWGIGLTSSGRLFIEQAQDTAFYPDGTSGRQLNDGFTHHVVVTWDTTTVRAYLDGYILPSTDTPPTPNIQSSQSISIATYNYSNIYSGTLDEIAFYNTTLTDAQILEHYTAGAGFLNYAQAQAQISTGSATTNRNFGQAQAYISVTLIADRPSRTESSGWGTPDIGAAWQGTDSDMSADSVDLINIMSVADTDQPVVVSPAGSNVIAKVRVKTDKLAVGDYLAPYVHLRDSNGTTYMRISVRFNTNQQIQLAADAFDSGGSTSLIALTTISGLTHAADTYFWIKSILINVDSTDFTTYSKIWQDGTPEPEAWGISGTFTNSEIVAATGGVALRSRTSGSNSNLPVTYRWRDLNYSALSSTTSPVKTAQAQAQAQIISTTYQSFAQVNSLISATASSGFPTIDSVTLSTQGGTETPSTITFATASAGDLILAFIATDSGGISHTWPSPWVEIKDEAGTGFVFSAAYLIATGGETSVDVAHTAERSNHLAARILAANWHGTTPPEINTGVPGSSDAPNPGSLTPSWGAENTLWIAVFGSDAEPLPVLAWPTNYADNHYENQTSISAASVALATQELNAASEDPGAFQMTITETWTAYTVAVRPAAGAQTYRVYAQANTYIKLIGLLVSAQAQVRIKNTYRGYAQAQVQIAGTGGYATIVRESFTSGGDGTVQTDHTIAVPTGWGAGDTLVVSLALNGSSLSASSGDAPNFPSITDSTGQSNPRFYMLIGTYADIGAGPWTLVSSSAVYNGYVATRYSGVDQTTPLDTAPVATNSPLGSATWSMTGLTTATNGAMLAVGMSANSSSSAVLTVDGGEPVTEYEQVWSSGAIKNTMAADGLFATAGPTGTIDGTLTSTGYAWAGVVVALRPAAGAGATTYRSYAQAQIRIKTTYRGYAQAQAHIKSTYRGYAQARPRIKNTYRAYAQARPRIKNTYRGYAQSQTRIKNTYPTYAQAQGHVRSTLYVSAQAQTSIKQTYLVYAQAQVKITTTRVHAQAQAQIKLIGKGYAQTQASIKQTYRNYAQANAQIKLVGLLVNSQAQARIKNTYRGYAQANAKIFYNALKVYAQSNARIKQIYRSFAQANTHIKLSDLQVYAQTNASIKSTYQGYAQAQTSVETTYRAYAQANAKILLSALTVNAQAQARIKNTYRGFAQANTKIIYSALQGYAQAQVRIKQTYRAFAQSNTYIKLSNLQSYAQAQTDIKQTYQVYAQALATTIRTYEQFGQSNAYIILSGLQQYAQAQFRIKVIYSVFAQVNSYIKLSNLKSYAQAQAAIKQTYQVSAQAQAKIVSTSFVSAQAQVKISTTRVHAQAQTSIKQLYTVTAQAQAYISGQGLWLAQAQVSIKTTYQVFAQANTIVRNTYLAYSQAQARIKNTYQAFAQTQTGIKNTYYAYAQATSTIFKPITAYQVFAQTQAAIKQVYVANAQAQTRVKTTYRGYAQSQAKIILSGLTACAQAQARIKQTYRGYAQSQAKIILLGLKIYAQSNASIKSIYLDSAQAQVYIKVVGIVALAQAQAQVKTVYRGYAQAQAHIITLGSIQTAQANAYIYTINQTYAQAGATIKKTGNTSNAQAQGYIYIPQYARPIADISNDGWVRVVI